MVEKTIGALCGVLVALGVFTSASADDSTHWHWKYDSDNSAKDPTLSESAWHSYCDAANWTVGTTGLNPQNRWPGSSDILYYGDYYNSLYAFDMGGNDITIFGIDDTEKKESSLWGYHKIVLRNGSLTLNNCFTNTRTHFCVWSGGLVKLADTCKTQMGRGSAQTHWYVHDGGYARMAGDAAFSAFEVDVLDGGTVDFAFSTLNHVNLGSGSPTRICNFGTLNFPQGMALTGTESSSSVTISQCAGTLTIAGNISKATAPKYQAAFYLNGGETVFSGNSALVGFDTAIISNASPVTVNVASGKSADYRSIAFMSGAQFTKTGAGEFIVGSGAPKSVTVSAGTLGVAGAVEFGSSLTLASGAELRFYGSGASATAIAGLSGATVSVDPSISSGAKVFSTTDSTLRTSVLAKIQSSASACGGAFAISGNDIIFTRSHEPSVFYWKNVDSSSWRYFNEAANWAVGTTETAGNPNNLVPGANDWIHYITNYSFTVSWDLQNLTHTIKGFDFTDWEKLGKPWGFHKFLLRNGTLEITQNFTNQRITVSLESNAKFILGPKSSSRLSQGDAQSWFTVKSGCEMIMGGYLQLVIPMIEVQSGGKFSFEPVELTSTDDFKTKTDHPDAYIRNFGTMDFPNGFHFLGGGANAGTLTIDSLDGTMTFGGSIHRADAAKGVFNFLFNGGTVNFNESSDLSWFAMAGSTNGNSTTSLNVAGDKSVKLPGGTYATGTKLVKLGAGSLIFDSGIPDALEVQNGNIELSGSGAEVKSLTMSSGTELTISGPGSVVNNFTGYNNVDFTVKVDNLSIGSVVLKSSNNTMLQALKNKASLPTGYYLTYSSGRLTLGNDSIGYVFNCSGEKSMSEKSGWTSGTVAPAGADVFVKGSSTVAVLDNTMNVYKSITVMDGATLKLRNLTAVPNLNLMYGANLKLVEGTGFSFTAGNVYCEADSELIPTFEIASGVTAAFAANSEFKNVDLRLYGTAKLTLPVFMGTAESGELAYFNFAATNATIDVTGAASSSGPLYWMAPKNATGRVRSPKGLSFKNMTYTTGGALFGNHIGYYSETTRNPDDEKFEVTLDQSSFLILFNTKNSITSGAEIKAINAGAVEKSPKYVASPGTYGHPYIEGQAQLTFNGANSWFGYYYDRYCVEANPATDGFNQMIFKSGASLRVHHFKGNGKAIYTFQDAFYDVLELPAYDRALWGGWVCKDSTWIKYNTGDHPGDDIPVNSIVENADLWKCTSPAFRGLKSVYIPTGSKLGFRGVNWYGIHTAKFVSNDTVSPSSSTPLITYSNEWDRIIYVDGKVPITGGGSVYVCNTVPNQSMTAIICSSNNTATGKAYAEADTVGNGNYLLFNDRANWAGTVVSNGRLGLTNSVESLRAARVSFENVQFDSPLPIRLWKDSKGTTNDCVTITGDTFVPTAGCLNPVPMGGYLPAAGDTFAIAELPLAVKSMSGRTYVANNLWLLVDEVDQDSVRRLKLRYAPGGILLNFRGAVPAAE